MGLSMAVGLGSICRISDYHIQETAGVEKGHREPTVLISTVLKAKAKRIRLLEKIILSH